MRWSPSPALAAVTVSAALFASVATPVPASAAVPEASLTRVTSFGENPSRLNMYLYVPPEVRRRPPILVVLHSCAGSASAVFNGGGRGYVTASELYRFVIVFPEATRAGACFDVSSPAALTRGGGGDPVGIVSMVDYVKRELNADPHRVFVTGASSGAMMTNVLAAAYPDIFAAGAAFAGLPAGCLAAAAGPGRRAACAAGRLIMTPRQWGDIARSMNPGYPGRYPRMQLWHGTDDTSLAFQNLDEEIKQWTDLHRVSQAPTFTRHPVPTWTLTRYGGDGGGDARVEAIALRGAGHRLPSAGMIRYVIAFFGLDGGRDVSFAR